MAPVLLLLLASIALGEPVGRPDGPPNVLPKDPLPAPAPVAPRAPVNDARLVGRVLERGSGLPVTGTIAVAGVVVPLDGGRFALDLPSGAHEVVFAGPDHVGIAVPETLVAGVALEVEYRVERFSWKEEIVVYGEEVREEVSRKVISAEELRSIPGSFGDPIRALQSLPGVARPATLEGDLVVRGAEALNTGAYVDEIPIPYLFHFFIGRSVINPALLDDVEFYAGGMPSRFGDVTQAVVNARTLDTDPEPGFHGRVGLDLLDFSVSGEGRIADHWTWQAGYRASWIPQLVGLGVRGYALVKGFGGEFRPGYAAIEYWDWMARGAYVNGRDRVVITGLGAHDALVFHPPRFDDDGDGKLDEPELPDLPYDPLRLMDSGFQRVQVRWDRTEGGREQTTWLAVGPDQESNLLQGIGQFADGVEFGELRGWSIVAKRQDRFPLGDEAIRTGVDVDLEPVVVEDWGDVDEDGTVAQTRDLRLSTGVWGEVQHRFGATWVAPGLRGAVHTFDDELRFEPEPRLTIRHDLDQRWTATGFVGRFSQVPPADRYAEGIGNPALGVMTAWQTAVGAEGRWPSGVEVDLTVYATRTADLIVKDLKMEVEPFLQVDPSDPSGGGYSDTAYSQLVAVYRPVTGYAAGVEGLVRMRPNAGWFGWVAFTAGKAIRVDEDGTAPGDYDLPVSVTLVGARDLPWDLQASGRFRVTSGYPYTPLHGVYLPEYDHWHGLPGDPNSERFPTFRQLDLRLDRTWTARRARWTVYVDVFNVLNTKNAFLATYTPNYDELVPSIWIPILPTFGLEVSY